MDERIIDIEGEIHAQTELAYLFFDGEQEIWLPKSRVEWDGETMSIPEWLALKEGLI